jgi:hypothetical protein
MSWFNGSGLIASTVLAASLAVAVSAGANVKHDGKWPDADKPVTLDLSAVPRSDALKKLADAAGWSLVVHGPSGDPVDVHVKQVPASKVLDILLDDGDWVATRDGTLVSLVHGDDSDDDGPPGRIVVNVPPIPPIPAMPPMPPVPGASASAKGAPPSGKDVKIQIGDGSEIDVPHARGQDRTVMGGNVTIAKGEVARDVTVFGGDVEIEGETTGDVTVFGGNVHVHDKARVRGDASVFGGTLTLDRDAKIDGDVSDYGGALRRDPGTHIGGEVKEGNEPPEHAAHRAFLSRAGEAAMDGLRLAAVLFVIGTVLLALGGRRMEALRAEVAMRPMRSMALGLVGFFGAILLLVALCVTIIGIPIAIIGLLVALFAVLGAMCAVLSVVGEALLRHKTENPYVHLAVGCAIFVVLAAIPVVGGFVIVATVLAGMGILVATRGAGFLQRKNGGTPYRTAAEVA